MNESKVDYLFFLRWLFHRKANAVWRKSVLVILTIFPQRRSASRRSFWKVLMVDLCRISLLPLAFFYMELCPSSKVLTMPCIPCGWLILRVWRDSNGRKRMSVISSQWWDLFKWFVDISINLLIFISHFLFWLLVFFTNTCFEWVSFSCIWIPKNVALLWLFLSRLHHYLSSQCSHH